MKNRIRAGLLALCVCLGAMTGCGKEEKPVLKELQNLQERGTINVGIRLSGLMCYRDGDGNFVGFDIDLATAVFEGLGLIPNFILIDWDQRQSLLTDGTVDCLWSGLTTLDAQEGVLGVSDPYLACRQVVVIRAEDADVLMEEADFAGKTFAVVDYQNGSVAVDAFFPESGTKDFGSVSLAMAGVQNHQTDAVMLEAADLLALTAADYPELTTAGGLGNMYLDYCVGFRAYSDLIDAVNQQFDNLNAEQFVQALAERYSLQEMMIYG